MHTFGRKLLKFLSFFIPLSLGILISIIGGITILGPKDTTKALQALVTKKNYIQEYYKIHPSTNDMFDSEDDQSTGQILSSSITTKDRTRIPPLLVPSSGIAHKTEFLYTGAMSEGKHEGIDIWTNIDGTGTDGTIESRGNPVYSACNGYVRNIWLENGDISIVCEELDNIYEEILPSTKIRLLYGHMADQFSKKKYIRVKKGQQVKKGELLGYQGNRCYYAPDNAVIHLHFGVYDMNTLPEVPLDPTPYLGVSCTTLNQTFSAGVQK